METYKRSRQQITMNSRGEKMEIDPHETLETLETLDRLGGFEARAMTTVRTVQMVGILREWLEKAVELTELPFPLPHDDRLYRSSVIGCAWKNVVIVNKTLVVADFRFYVILLYTLRYTTQSQE